MTNEEIRKLLGGYATNTLTEAERKVLFEAALDNQELFNAMQEEEALKDLLSDPVSREQVRQALETPATAKPAGVWWSQWWAWGSAAGAVAAAILIVAVIRSTNPVRRYLQEMASMPATKSVGQPAPLAKDAAAPPKPEPGRARTFRPPRTTAGAPEQRKDEVDFSRALPPPAPAAAAPQPQERESAAARAGASAEAPRSQDAGHSQNAQATQNGALNGRDSNANQGGIRQEQLQTERAVNALRDSDRLAATPGQFGLRGAAGFTGGPLRFSLMKRDSNGVFVPLPPTSPDLKKGDAVQLRVVPVLAGYISLSQLDQSGAWRRVFPSSGPGIPVVANGAYSIPDAPIEVTGKEEKFRVALALPAPGNKSDAVDKIAVEKEMRSLKRAKSAASPKAAPQPSPLFVDLTIGPKN
ncbi:MAG TPA: hypothetical protein VIX89_19705 [Bryobacteraceae bacterium]